MKFLITGGTNGMGKGLALALAGLESPRTLEILILGRSADLGQKTIKEIQDRHPQAQVSLVLCDLARMASVTQAVQDLKAQHSHLDGIFINAGLGYAAQRVVTEDGLDSHFQVNYLAQAYLVQELLPLLEQSTLGPRVIFNVTPVGKISWEDPQMEKTWTYEKAITQAMAAKRMFLIQMDQWCRSRSPRVSFVGFSIHKTVWSNQLNIIPPFMRFMATVMKTLGTFISIEECGQVMAPLFVEPKDLTLQRSGGFYTWKNGNFVALPETPEVLDPQRRLRFWEYSQGHLQRLVLQN